MRIRSKKGVTLTELIISMAVMVMIVAAAYTLLNVTQKSYRQAADNALNYLNYSLADTYVFGNADKVTEVKYGSDLERMTKENEYLAFYVNENGELQVIVNGKTQTVGKIDGDFSFCFVKLGNTENARAGFRYSFEANAKTYEGGAVLENISFENMEKTGYVYGEDTKQVNENNYLVFVI